MPNTFIGCPNCGSVACLLFPRKQCRKPFNKPKMKPQTKTTKRASYAEGHRTNDNCECRVSGGEFHFCPLHAAAPELLEALQGVLTTVERYGLNRTSSSSLWMKEQGVDAILDNARAAIAKAIGGEL